MDRRNFIRNTFGASLGLLAFGRQRDEPAGNEEDLLVSITRSNDQNVERLLRNYRQIAESSGNRVLSGFLLSVSAAYCAKDSRYFHDRDVVDPMLEVIHALQKRQNRNGTFDFGNIQSPPDSGFMAEQFFRTQALLIKDNSDQTTGLRESLKEVMLRTSEALVTGGVHTPNHRWVICAALAGTHAVYPDNRYVERINDWLGEGIGQDEDGQHPERSPNYDASVNNPSLLDVAKYMDRPELLEFVRKNLEMTIYLLELNGEVETVASRRQDAGRSFMINRYYLPYRYMAIRDNNPRFAEMAHMIEMNFMSSLGVNLPEFLLHEELNDQLPSRNPLPENYTHHLSNSHLIRIRRGEMTASIFGGTDWHLGHKVWSGLSHNPTFFKLRKGGAILESVRMSPAFFRTGYFRSDGLTVNGITYQLSEKRQTPYHQPLPQEYRSDDGMYKMSPDGRFFSKMDFEKRPKDFVELHSNVTITEMNNGIFEFDITVDQTPDVAVTIELCFRKGGELSGVIPNEGDDDSYFLKENTGSYRVGNDVIEFGPGRKEHGRPPESNEQYAVHNGEIATDGYRVFITLNTPFQHTLRIG